MKTFKTLLTLLSIFLLYSLANAQGGCRDGNIMVYAGGNGPGCKCLKECVTPEELPVYLANFWNTVGCYNCSKFKNWVDAETPKTSLEEVHPSADPGSLTVSFTLASQSDVKIQIKDMTGRTVAIVADEYREDLDNELIWDDSTLTPGIYFLTLEAGDYSETKKISVTE